MTDRNSARSCAAKTARGNARTALLLTASIGALCALAPTAAQAQALPAGCTPGVATAGATINCVAPPNPIGPITTLVPDLTINIGTPDTPTVVIGGAPGDNGVLMAGGGNLTLNVVNQASGIGGDLDGAAVIVAPTGNNLTINSAGTIIGGNNGIYAVNLGSGDTAITSYAAAGIIGSSGPRSGNGIYAYDGANAGTLTITSTGTATGANSGIQARHYGSGDVTVTANRAYGTASNGIAVYSFSPGNVSITTTGLVQGGTGGIYARALAGVSITAAGEVTGQGTFGIAAAANGPITISATGTVNGNTLGVVALQTMGGSGDVEVAVHTVNAMGPNSFGVVAGASGGNLDISADGAVTAGGTGIYALNSGSGTTTVSTSGVTASNGDGIFAANATGRTSTTPVAAGDLDIFTKQTTSGSVNGIFAINRGTGDTNIIAQGNVISTGPSGSLNSGNGILAINGDTAGALNIITEGAVQGNGSGIAAYSSGTGAINIITSQAVTGTDLSGIAANHTGTGDVNVIASGPVTGGLTGIYSRATSGNLTDVTDAPVTGGIYGIVAETTTGQVTVVSGDVTGTSGTGIFVRNQSVDGTDVAVVSSGTVTGGQQGIYARNIGTGSTLVSAVDVTGGTGDGIRVINATNSIFGPYFGPANTEDLTITSTGTVTGGNNGIYAYNFGAGNTVITSVNAISTQAAAGFSNTGNGIAAFSQVETDATRFGRITITSTGLASGVEAGISAIHRGAADITVSANDVAGGRFGIFAQNGDFAPGSPGTPTVQVTSTGTVTGGIFGIRAESVGGTRVYSGSTVTGGRAGISAHSFGDAPLIVVADNAIGTDADIGTGVETRNFGNGGNTVTVNGTATGQLDGVFVANEGGGETRVIAATTVGTTGNGIVAVNATGGYGASTDALPSPATDLFVTSTSASGGIDGIAALNNGTRQTVVTSVDATGIGRAGLEVINGTAATDLTVNSTGAASGNAFGILADNEGTGALTIVADDVIGETAIVAAEANGTASITTTGTVSGTAGDGINLALYSNSAATVANSGVIDGTADGIRLTNTLDQGTLTVNNTGSISGGIAAIQSNSATTINNAGTINGRVALSELGDQFNNTGLFNTSGTSDFGGDADLFANAGTIRATGATTFANLEQLANSGLTTLANGSPTDTLTLPGTFVGTGNSTVALDVSLAGAGSADRLVIGGAATGSTALSLNVLSLGTGFGQSILLVDAGAGSSATAFSLADGPVVTAGFRAFGINYVPDGNNFYLNSGASVAAFRTSLFEAGEQQLWYRSADAWAAHMRSIRDTGAGSGRLWLEFQGTTSSTRKRVSYDGLGFAQTFRLDHHQDYFGAQAGLDIVSTAGGQGFTAGITGGYLNSHLTFDGTPDRVTYSVANVGAYAGFRADGFFLNALFKYDFVNARVFAPLSGYEARPDGHSYGGRGEIGYRFGTTGFFLEPSGSIEYVRTDLDSFDALDAQVRFRNLEGVRGMAGAKLGGSSGIGGGSVLTYYLSGQAVHEFEGDNRVTIDFGTGAFTDVNRRQPTFGRGEAGLAIRSSGGVTGFIQGDLDAGSRYRSYGGRAGIRFGF